jgi:hypothetical protein
MRSILALTVFASAWTTGAAAFEVPADPISYLNGYWYGEDRKIELEVKNGVATVKVNESEDPFVRKLSIPPGTVIGRFTRGEQTSSNSVAFQGECWQMLDTVNASLYNCEGIRAGLTISEDAGKRVDRLKIAGQTFIRKGQLAEWMWQYRK